MSNWPVVVRGPSCNIGRGETGIPGEKEMEEEKELDLMKNTKYHTIKNLPSNCF